jgi:hypothetical protein
MTKVIPTWRRPLRRVGEAADPYFQSVTWLLHMDGANGATSFADSSRYARASTPYGAAQISSAQSKFGGSSGYFTTNSHIRTTPVTELWLNGDFTLETFVYPNTSADMMLAGSTSTSNTQIFRLNESGTAGRLSLYDGFSNVFSNLSAGITANSWQHLAYARIGTITRAFRNGVVVGTNTTWTGTLRCDVIGSGFFSGNGANWANAYIDEFRVTKGVCRYTGNFTPPGSAFQGLL